MNSGGMMKRSLALLIVLMIGILPATAFSQALIYQLGADTVIYNPLGNVGFSNSGGGARAAGMGGAFMGVSEGEMTYSWNPAGLMFQEKRSIGLQFNSNNGKNKSAWVDQYYNTNGLINANVQEVSFKNKHSNFDFSGFSVPFNFFDKSWAVGGGFRTVIDMTSEAEGVGLAGSRDIYTASGGIDAISLALAGKINDYLAIGLTANNYIRNDDENVFFGKAFSYIPNTGTQPDTVDVWVSQNTHYKGFNADIGLMGQYNMFKGGFVIHTPFDLKATDRRTSTFMIPPSPRGTIDRITYTSSIPMGFTIGVSAKPMEKLLVALDFDSRPMSSAEIDVNYESSLISDIKVDPKWEDLNQFRIGAEYKFKTEFAEIPVRFGFRNNPSVYKELTSEILQADSSVIRAYGDKLNTNIISFGSGLQFEKAWIDIAYQFGSSSYNTTINYGTEKIIEQKIDYSRLLISAGMNF
jgi:hypothetical protein